MASTINASTSSGIVQTADTSGVLQLQTANTTAVTIDASQNVGIGTTSPTDKLTIVENGQGTAWTGGAVNTPSVILDSGITGGGYSLNGINFSANSARSFIYNYSTAVGNANLAFGANGSERMRIDTSGNFMVAMAALDPTTSGFYVNASTLANTHSVSSNTRTDGSGFNLMTNRQGSNGTAIEFRRTNATVGSVSVTTTATAYNTSSDYRLKENIAPMSGALDTVAQLKPVTYTWKADGSNGQGFIAHELKSVVPDAVTGEKDAVDEEGNPIYQAIDTSFLVATLTAAIQELKAELDATKAEVAALKGKA